MGSFGMSKSMRKIIHIPLARLIESQKPLEFGRRRRSLKRASKKGSICLDEIEGRAGGRPSLFAEMMGGIDIASGVVEVGC